MAKSLALDSYLGPALSVVVTTFRPPPNIFQSLGKLFPLTASIIVVDNTPGSHGFPEHDERFVLVQDGENKGLGRALNIGLEQARKLGADIVLLLDQDSTPDVRQICLLLNTLSALVYEGQPRYCLAPRHIDDAVGVIPALRDGHISDSALTAVDRLPTSGMMFSVRALEVDDGFAEDLFLDFVDYEWCWRLRKKGWKFATHPHAFMLHRLGAPGDGAFGLIKTVWEPYRHYFQFRDAARLCFRSYVPTSIRFRLAFRLLVKLIIHPITLDRGGERLGWMARGLVDALRGVNGIGAAKLRLGQAKHTGNSSS